MLSGRAVITTALGAKNSVSLRNKAVKRALGTFDFLLGSNNRTGETPLAPALSTQVPLFFGFHV